jgi:alpha-L-rhamnosidase
LELAVKMAKILGRPWQAYQQYADHMRQAVKTAYYNEETREYCNNYQGAHAYAAWVGLADTDIIAAMAEKYRQTRRFDTGFLGTQILCDVLFENGYADVVHDIMENDTLGTFLYQKRLGATTLWEYWKGGSNNHPMFGGCVSTIVNYLLGIRPADDLGTYQNLLIAPCIPNEMHFARGSITTSWGITSCAWERKGDIITFSITVPENVNAIFRFGSHERLLSAGTQEFTL